MKQLLDAMGMELFWEQPKLSQQCYSLQAGEDTFGQLRFSKAFNTAAEALMGDNNYIITQVGFLSGRVSIRHAGLEEELASFQPNVTGSAGEILVSTGGKYTWRITNILGTTYSIDKVGGLELITYHSRARSRKFSNLFKQQAQVVISPGAWHIDELPILILLGWYLVILHQENAAVIASTASFAALY